MEPQTRGTIPAEAAIILSRMALPLRGPRRPASGCVTYWARCRESGPAETGTYSLAATPSDNFIIVYGVYHLRDHTNQNRRQFLRTTFAGAGVAALSACGGGTPAASQSKSALAQSGSGGVTAAPPVPAPTSVPFAWQIAPDQTLVLAAGTSTTIATGAAGMTVGISPSLPTGRTLTVNASGQVAIVAAPDAPSIDMYGPWVIAVSS